jgi:hypothetical protein
MNTFIPTMENQEMNQYKTVGNLLDKSFISISITYQ